MKVAIVPSSLLFAVTDWSAQRIIPLMEEVEAQDVDITDISAIKQIDRDMSWLQKNAQKQRLLPMPNRGKSK